MTNADDVSPFIFASRRGGVIAQGDAALVPAMSSAVLSQACSRRASRGARRWLLRTPASVRRTLAPPASHPRLGSYLGGS